MWTLQKHYSEILQVCLVVDLEIHGSTWIDQTEVWTLVKTNYYTNLRKYESHHVHNS